MFFTISHPNCNQSYMPVPPKLSLLKLSENCSQFRTSVKVTRFLIVKYYSLSWFYDAITAHSESGLHSFFSLGDNCNAQFFSWW
jgi:hypothetical protein